MYDELDKNHLTVLSCRVEKHKVEEIKAVAKKDHRSVSNFISMLIDKFIADYRFEQWKAKK
jgi:hypothetical protein